MSSFEVGGCNIAEYIASEEQRVDESNILIGSLYTIMFLLKGDYGAAKYPARIIDAETSNNTGRAVEMTIMNADLAPDFDCHALFRQGYWQRRKSEGINVDEKPVVSGYLKPYFDDMDGKLHEILTATVERPINTKSTHVVGMRGH